MIAIQYLPNSTCHTYLVVYTDMKEYIGVKLTEVDDFGIRKIVANIRTVFYTSQTLRGMAALLAPCSSITLPCSTFVVTL